MIYRLTVFVIHDCERIEMPSDMYGIHCGHFKKNNIVLFKFDIKKITATETGRLWSVIK